MYESMKLTISKVDSWILNGKNVGNGILPPLSQSWLSQFRNLVYNLISYIAIDLLIDRARNPSILPDGYIGTRSHPPTHVCLKKSFRSPYTLRGITRIYWQNSAGGLIHCSHYPTPVSENRSSNSWKS
ncbi:hypothetical protein V6Z12_D02G134700 [Gossypium hirsutum]